MPKTVRSRKTRKSNVFRKPIRLALLGLLLTGAAIVPSLRANAAGLSQASVAISDPRPSALSANYTFTGSSVTTTPIKCIKQVYSDSVSGTTVPAGMGTNGGGVTLDAAGTNFIPTPGSWTLNKPANGTLTLTNATGETPASASARKLSINGITNSSIADTKLYLRVTTYNNTDCATSPVDSALVLFILTNGSTLSLTVDPTLTFTVNAVASGQACNGATSTAASTSTTIPFGTVTSATNSVVCQDLIASTNATNGYTIYTRYTAQPTDALAHTIANTSGSNTTPAAFPVAGNEAYGYTTNDFTLGTGTAGRFNANQWAAMTTNNAEVAFEAAGVSSTTYRVGHQVGVSNLTRPGTYTTTIIYTCTPVF